MKSFILKNKILIFAICLFLLSTISLFVAGNYNKQLNQYWDEMRFYEIAKNIYFNRGIVVRNIPSNFQKILYPLIISPTFAISNVSVRLKVINLINCISISSSFIPLYFISKEMNLNGKNIITFLIISFFAPIMIYSVGFMSEVLAYPLSIWAIYLFIKYFKNNNYVYPAIIGVYLYVLYLCKETALIFLIAFCCLQFLFFFSFKDNKLKNIKFIFNKKILLQTIETILCFFACFILFKLTLFRGMNNSYDQTSIKALNSFKMFLFMIYGFLYYLIGYSLSVLILPILIPSLVFSKMNGLFKRIFALFIIYIVITAAIVSYTIYIREDPGELVPTMHLRYTIPFFIILIGILLYLSQERIALPKLNKKQIILICSYALLFILIYKGTRSLLRNHDIYSLIWFQYIQSILKQTFKEYTTIGYILSIVAINVLIITLLFVCYYFIDKKKTYNPIIGATACVFALSYSLAIYTSYKNYRVNDVEMNELINIDDYIYKNNQNSKILIIVDNWFNTSNAVDLYIEKMSAGSLIVRQKSFEDELAKFGSNVIKVNEISFYENTLLYKYPTISHLDYFLIKTSVPLRKYKLNDITNVNECSGQIWNCFSNNNPSTITIKNI